MSKPIAVLISDVHYSLPTLKLADAAMRMAINKANNLNVPLIVTGDLHDTKANMRAECVNAMIETFELCINQIYIVIGNHDRINEKSYEHSLNFLNKYNVIDKMMVASDLSFIPYQHDPESAADAFSVMPKSSIVIMHQGIQGSNSGEYIQDKSAINPKDAAGMRVISGHYHTRQDIELPDGGLWSYIGNPYTLNYAEANDPPKGFQILMDDGSLKFAPTNLRKHIVYTVTASDLIEGNYKTPRTQPEDLVWVKVEGTKLELSGLDKTGIGNRLGLKDFRLDLIPTDLAVNTNKAQQKLSGGELVDSIIDQLSDVSEGQTARLKSKWRALCE